MVGGETPGRAAAAPASTRAKQKLWMAFLPTGAAPSRPRRYGGIHRGESNEAEVASRRRSSILNLALDVMYRQKSFSASLVGSIRIISKVQWRWYTVQRSFAAAHIWPYVLNAGVERALKAEKSFQECAAVLEKDYCPEMVVLPAGAFLMGSLLANRDVQLDELPKHRVTITGSLAVSKFELTFDEWDTCVAYGSCRPGISAAQGARGRQPVINVDWDDAQQYVAWLSQMTGKTYRLLSEAEYEYAARAGSTTEYPWGDELGKNNADCHGCGQLRMGWRRDGASVPFRRMHSVCTIWLET